MWKFILPIFIVCFVSITHAETCPSINELNQPDAFGHVPSEPDGWVASAMDKDIALDRFTWAAWSPTDSYSANDEQVICNYINKNNHTWQLTKVDYIQESQLINHPEWKKVQVGHRYIYRCENADPMQCSFD